MSSARSPEVPHSSLGLERLVPAHGWIIGPRADLLLFLGTPLLLVGLFAFAERFWTLTGLTLFATVLAMGHYLPGLMRAYGDPVLFRRFRWRFLLAPIFLIYTAMVLSKQAPEAFLLVLVSWGAWHWLMQAYGLVRIYDAKLKNFDQASARFDYAFCIAWFGVIYWQTDGASAVLLHFYKAGGTLATDLLRWGVVLWGVATAAITVGYVAHLVRRTRAGYPPSLLKLALLSVTFCFYYYAFGYTSSYLIAFALFEGYHDIQYLAIVWIFNRNRADKDPQAGSFTRFLFRQRAPLVVLYVALCVGFGSYDFVARNWVDDRSLAQTALGLITGLALVHFYFDGFIWRIRESATRTTLGMAGDKNARIPAPWPSYVRHALLWLLFLVPTCGLAGWEAAQRSLAGADDSSEQPYDDRDAVQAYHAVLAVRPDSHKMHFLLSQALMKSDQNELALEHAARSRALRPGYDVYDMHYADLRLASGGLTVEELDEVIACYENAAITRPGEPELHRNWAKALLRRGDVGRAAARYRIALERAPLDASLHFEYGGVLALQQEWPAAGDAFAAAVRLDPELVEAQAMLGNIRMAEGRPGDALHHFREVLKREPDRIRTLSQLALGLATVSDPQLRDPAAAVQLAERARELADGPDAQLLQSLAAAYAAAGRFAEAAPAATAAAELFRSSGQPALATQLDEAAARHREGRP